MDAALTGHRGLVNGSERARGAYSDHEILPRAVVSGPAARPWTLDPR
jgi:hypothetical protein